MRPSANKTTIDWTDFSWNPLVGGCFSPNVSPGCNRCYANTLAERFRGVAGNHFEHGFDLRFWPERLPIPYGIKKPSKIFVNSMSDLFHKDVPLEFIQQVFQVMNETCWREVGGARLPWHTYQILTKRPSRAALIADKLNWSPNIQMGVSIENDDYVWRADKLREIPAATRFISAEPLLGELTRLNLERIDWLIAGAESGRGARPMDEDWVRFLRDRCVDENVAFFYKQNAYTSGKQRGQKIHTPELDGRRWVQFPIPPAALDQPRIGECYYNFTIASDDPSDRDNTTRVRAH